MKTFTKLFTSKYGSLSSEINKYAKENNLEIVCVSLAEQFDYLNAIVVFKEQ